MGVLKSKAKDGSKRKGMAFLPYALNLDQSRDCSRIIWGDNFTLIFSSINIAAYVAHGVARTLLRTAEAM